MLDFIPAHRSTEGIVSGLKQALREAAHDSDQTQPQPSTTQLTLQVSALHNAFLALSDAFTESLEVSRRKELQWEAAMQAIQQRFASEVAAVEALRDDYHQLASKNAGLHKENCWLRARVEGLEGSISRLDTELWKQERQIWDVSQEVSMAIEADLPAACEFAAKEWAEQHLPGLARTALADINNKLVEEGSELSSAPAGDVDHSGPSHWRNYSL
ncbi:hypothetical protein ACKKBG_A33400 [Auxenochlorella protothecoides x Auxenochlorella symbiontica]